MLPLTSLKILKKYEVNQSDKKYITLIYKIKIELKKAKMRCH